MFIPSDLAVLTGAVFGVVFWCLLTASVYIVSRLVNKGVKADRERKCHKLF